MFFSYVALLCLISFAFSDVFPMLFSYVFLMPFSYVFSYVVSYIFPYDFSLRFFSFHLFFL